MGDGRVVGMGSMCQVEQLVQELSRGCVRSNLDCRGGLLHPAWADDAPARPGLRIGELSRRVGVTPEVLRAWERRYGVLQPHRSRSGQRLYTAADEERVRQMLGHMQGGYSPAVAARLATATAEPRPRRRPPARPRPRRAARRAPRRAARPRRRRRRGRVRPAARRVRARHGPARRVLPVLADLGEQLGARHGHGRPGALRDGGDRGRLHALGRSRDAGRRPSRRPRLPVRRAPRARAAVLRASPCAAGDGASATSARTRRPLRSWRSPSSSTPSSSSSARSAPSRSSGRRPARGARRGTTVCVGGRGASAALAARLGAERLPDDPIAAADLVSARRNP